MAEHLDFSATQTRIFSTSGSAPDFALNLNTKFIADALGSCKHVGPIRIANNLRQAFTIAQIDKDDPTVITAAMNPSKKCYELIKVISTNQTGITSTHTNRPKNQLSLATSSVVVQFDGATTPIETTYFSASSTLISNSITSCLSMTRKKPEVGLGVVGT